MPAQWLEYSRNVRNARAMAVILAQWPQCSRNGCNGRAMTAILVQWLQCSRNGPQWLCDRLKYREITAVFPACARGVLNFAGTKARQVAFGLPPASLKGL